MTPGKQRTLVAILIGLGLVIVGFFGLRTVKAFREFRGHRPPPRVERGQAATDVELIRDWMTIPFLAKMYRVPPPLLFDTLGIPHSGNEEKSLRQLNDAYFPDQPGHVLAVVKATIQANLPPSIPLPAATMNPPTPPVVPGSP